MVEHISTILLRTYSTYRTDERLNDLAHKMFSMYTDLGFPPDMFLKTTAKDYSLSPDEQLYIISVYQSLFLAHRRKSGVQEKNLARIRRRNREDIERYTTTGEVGVY